MHIKDYVAFFILLVLNFFSLFAVLLRSDAGLLEVLIIIAILILSAIFMRGIYHEEKWGYGLAAAVFAVGLFNAVYVYFNYISYIVVFLVFVNAMGFVIAITRVKNLEENKDKFFAMFKNIDLAPKPAENEDAVSVRRMRSPILSRPVYRRIRPKPTQHFRHIDDFTQRIEESQSALEGIPKLHSRQPIIHHNHPRHHNNPHYHNNHHQTAAPSSQSLRSSQMKDLNVVFAELSSQVDALENKSAALKKQAKQAEKPQASENTRKPGMIPAASQMSGSGSKMELYFGSDEQAKKDLPLEVYDIESSIRELDDFAKQLNKKNSKSNTADTASSAEFIQLLNNLPKEGKIEVLEKPGRFVSSEFGKKFHDPKCETAKRIAKSSQVWFDAPKDARKQGYVPCNCVRRFAKDSQSNKF